MLISFVAATYDRPKHLRVLLDCLVAQELDNWECHVMDEGDNAAVIPDDPRFKYHKVPRIVPFPDKDPRGSFGLLPKDAGVPFANGDWITFPSEDIYYVPQFTKIMAQSLAQNPDKDIIACDFVCDHRGYQVITAAPKLSFTDNSNYIMRKSAIKGVKFADFFQDHHRMGWADGLFMEKVVSNGAKFIRIPHILMVHN